MIAFAENPYWWSEEAKNFSTRVLDVGYYAKRRVKTLKSAMRIECEVRPGTYARIGANVTVPSKLDQWTEKSLDELIKIHRVDVIKGAALIIKFHKVGDQDYIKVRFWHVVIVYLIIIFSWP